LKNSSLPIKSLQRIGGIVKLFFVFFSLFISIQAIGRPLVIHASSLGVGKFHRIDNAIHAYSDKSAWRPYILPNEAKKPLTVENADGSVSIFFTSLEGLLTEAMRLVKEKKQKIQILNVHSHGLPGGMGFPGDEKMKNSPACDHWRKVEENGSDQDNYNGYYFPVPKQLIMMLREISRGLDPSNYSCISGAKVWQQVITRLEVPPMFTDNGEINFLGCAVGLGLAGKHFLATVGKLLLTGNQAMARAPIKLGLGDWSMDEGLGFWDYENDEQLNRDNAISMAKKRDREIMQMGPVRVTFPSSKSWSSISVTKLDFLRFLLPENSVVSSTTPEEENFLPTPRQLPQRIQIPKTLIFADLILN
jgi:hypothetical protein